MRLYYGTKVKVCIAIPKHVKSILEIEVDDMDGIAKTPAAHHIFTVIENGDTLMGTQANFFRTLVANILSVICRSRPNLKTALAFLTTRVRNPDGDE